VLDLLIFIVSFIILLKGAELFIDSSVIISKLWGFSQFFIGIVLVGIGTSLPELTVSLFAAVSKNTSLIMGQIMGSNIANTSLILGIASLLIAIQMKKGEFQTEVKTLLAICVLFLILCFDRTLSWPEGLALLFIFAIYIYQKYKLIPEKEKEHKKIIAEIIKKKKNIQPIREYEKILKEKISYRTFHALLKEGIDLREAYEKKITKSIAKNIIIALISLFAIIISSRFVVSSAVELANYLNIAPEIIGMTAIALGTSLPELSVVFTCARKGLPSIIIGNIVGSNMANILLVGGVASLIAPLKVTILDLILIFPFMIILTLVFLRFLKTKWITKLLEGIMLIFFYIIFLFLIVLIAAI